MKAIIINRFGGPEAMSEVELPRPELPSDGIRIQVAASGVNFADLMMRMGMYPEAPKPPFSPGYEVSGVVTETGKDVRTFRVGDRVVAGTRFGGYASEVAIPEHQARRVPEHLTDTEAAAIPVTFITAWLALHEMSRVRAGDRVLIQSAAGGVGLAACQIAANAGAEVHGLVSSEAKFAETRAHGANRMWTYEEWANSRSEEARHYDIILDSAGGRRLKESFHRLTAAGRVVTFGAADLVGGPKRSWLKAASFLSGTPFFTPFQLMMRNVGVYGLNVLQIFDQPGTPRFKVMNRVLDQIMAQFEQKRLRVKVGATFPLSQAGRAHEHLQSRKNVGKVVLVHLDESEKR